MASSFKNVHLHMSDVLDSPVSSFLEEGLLPEPQIQGLC